MPQGMKNQRHDKRIQDSSSRKFLAAATSQRNFLNLFSVDSMRDFELQTDLFRYSRTQDVIGIEVINKSNS